MQGLYKIPTEDALSRQNYREGNILPQFFLPQYCSLIYVNTRLGTDHHQHIMSPISKDCYTALERLFIYAAPCECNISEHLILIVSGSGVINVNYCKFNLHVHWSLNIF